MKTAITELLNIEYPIVQGAMAWVADADLASAVSNAGGLGVIGTGHDNVDTVRAKVEAMFAKTDKPFAVNVMLLNPHVEEVVDYLIASGVKIITTQQNFQIGLAPGVAVNFRAHLQRLARSQRALGPRVQHRPAVAKARHAFAPQQVFCTFVVLCNGVSKKQQKH